MAIGLIGIRNHHGTRDVSEGVRRIRVDNRGRRADRLNHRSIVGAGDCDGDIVQLRSVGLAGIIRDGNRIGQDEGLVLSQEVEGLGG